MSANKIKILLVDDDEQLLKSVSEVFELFGFHVQTATGGDEAWEKLQKESADLVISDIRMSAGSGVELLEKCKAHNPENPKFLLVSGFDDYSSALLYDMGVDGFFAKPFDTNAVRNAIKETLLDLQSLWGMDKSPNIKKHLHKEFKEVQFGRRGFFLPISTDFPKVGDVVSFELNSETGTPHPQIKGYGKVLWKREQTVQEYKAGVGVEIQYIEGEALLPFIKWLEDSKFRAFIPIGE